MPVADLDAYAAELAALGRQHGLDTVGVAPADPFERALGALRARRAAGLDDGMAFTYKHPERSTDPRAAVRGARAVLVGARAYAAPRPERPSTAHGRVARYAWRDHYAPLREALWVVARRLRADGYKAVPFADDNSLVDREAAWLAGLGWFGKNANLLLPGAGSWFVLGSVVTDAPLPTAAGPVADGCGSCRRCVDACPTGAIVAPGVIDAGRCLAWVLQKPGSIPLALREAAGDRIYGCDDCQEVCPPALRAERVAAPPEATDVAWVGLVELLEATDDELLERHGRWYLAGRDPRWLRRNALVALGNSGASGDPTVAAALERVLAGDDELLREHAAWAAGRLGLRSPTTAPVGADTGWQGRR